MVQRPCLEQLLIHPAANQLGNPVPAQALSGQQPQMGYFISKATFSCAVICLICPSAPTFLTLTRLRFAWDGRREGRKLEETEKELNLAWV